MRQNCIPQESSAFILYKLIQIFCSSPFSLLTDISFWWVEFYLLLLFIPSHGSLLFNLCCFWSALSVGSGVWFCLLRPDGNTLRSVDFSEFWWAGFASGKFGPCISQRAESRNHMLLGLLCLCTVSSPMVSSLMHSAGETPPASNQWPQMKIRTHLYCTIYTNCPWVNKMKTDFWVTDEHSGFPGRRWCAC